MTPPDSYTKLCKPKYVLTPLSVDTAKAVVFNVFKSVEYAVVALKNPSAQNKAIIPAI